MGCAAVTLRTENAKNVDVRVDRPCDSPAIVVKVGDAPSTGLTVTTALGQGSCSVFGAGGSGSGYVRTSTVTKDSGTPYGVSTVSTIG